MENVNVTDTTSAQNGAEVARQLIYSVPMFRIGLLCHFTVSAAVIATNSLLLVVLRQTRLMDANIRLLLANHAFACVLYALSATVMLIYRLTMRPQSVRVDKCFMEEMVPLISTMAVFFTIFAVGVERVYATYNATRYSQDKATVALFGQRSITAIWVTSLLVEFVLLFGALLGANEEMTIDYCNILFIAPAPFLYVFFGVMCVVEVSGGLLFLHVLKWNERLQQSFAHGPTGAHQSLSMRTQLKRNIKVTDMLITTASLHAAIYLPCCILAMCIRIWLPLDQLRRLALAECLMNVVIPTYMAAQPIVLAWRSNTIRAKMYRIIGSERVVPLDQSVANIESDTKREAGTKARTPSTTDEEMKIYFSQLRTMWNSDVPKR